MQDIKKITEACSNLSVLLVEDEEDSRLQVYNILTLFFHTVLVANNGQEALTIYKQKKVDIIITDLTMPIMSGFELLEAVRKIYSNQKIIVISAHTETDIIIQAIKKSVDGYILKPIDAIQMFEAIEKTAKSLKIENENIQYQNNLETKVDTQAKQLVQQLEHDSLTGLANKEKLELDIVSKDISEIILLNIDNFSHINTTYGHHDGDILLQEIAIFLYSIVDDSLYRGNGDEFFIALQSSTSIDALELAKEIKQKVYSKRFDTSSASVRITFSMGIVAIEDPNDGIPYEKAQLAISDMRKLHKNTIGYYNKSSKTENYQQQMHEWAHKTKLALDFDLLVPYYQPIVNVKTGVVEKYECLARILENDTPVSPFYFIEAARIAGMLTNITRRIILKAFGTFSNTNKEFSINITDDDLQEEYLLEYLHEQCSIFNIKPSQIVLEVLENISNYDAGHAIEQIDKLKLSGFQIAIDDFGSESSNFARVQKLHVDYIKIDGGFIKDIALNHNSLIIVKTIIYYAKSCGLKTIAEYVHDEDTYNIIKELDIDYVQGYYFSEPLRDIL